ncbi:HAD-IA family hydrolase [Bordetella genomosp. 13]|uniref:HAD-IA family hydrolase n=1 Tax=Bordetella genomosp. 13 TaxID=463040 RepID=UPI0011AA2F66|nr:HAD-IA family hydrolase [Bordetella genomosp. 13]
MKPRIAAFDFDGTLADTLPWFDGILDDVADRYGFRKPDAQERLRMRHCSAQEILRMLRVPFWKLPAIMIHVRQRMADAAPGEVRLFDGIADALAQLKEAGVQLAVVSSNSLDNVRRVLGPKVQTLFDDYECGTDMFGKPAKLKRLLARHAIPPQQLMLVGDELRDIEAARQAGVRVGCVAWGYNHVDALRAGSPDTLFLDVADIPAQLA